MVDEIVVGFEDAVGEPVVARELPDVLHGGGGRFCKVLEPARGWPRGTRWGRWVAVAQVPRLRVGRLVGDGEGEYVDDPFRKRDQLPGHHAWPPRDRATLDHAGDGLPL